MPPGRLPVAAILSNWDKTEAGKIKNMLEGLNIPSALGLPQDLPAKAKSFNHVVCWYSPYQELTGLFSTFNSKKCHYPKNSNVITLNIYWHASSPKTFQRFYRCHLLQLLVWRALLFLSPSLCFLKNFLAKSFTPLFIAVCKCVCDV